MKGKKYAGFSLIEILVVVALMVILATITIVAINPAKNFRDTRDAQRSADVLQILNAVTQYTSEEGHTLADLGTISTCPTETCIGTGTACVDLAGDGTNKLVEEYIVEIPMDPSERDQQILVIPFVKQSQEGFKFLLHLKHKVRQLS